jgi:predicted outer membrane repeat protein
MKRKCSILSLLIALIVLTAGCSAVSSTNNSNGGGSGETAVEGNAVFVSALGSTNNSGLTKSSPLLSLQAAVNLAKASNFSAIYISGNLVETNFNSLGISIYLDSMTNLDISGGWSSDYSSRSGESLIDGRQYVESVIGISNCYGIILRGMAIIGGIKMILSASNTINCTLSNNISAYGGGIGIISSTNNWISGLIVLNNASSGGGLSEVNSASNTVSAVISNNTADNSGGGVYMEYCGYDSYTGMVSGNISTSECAGISSYSCHNVLYSCGIINNRATGWWVGGIGFVGSDSCSNTISGIVSGNSTVQSGGGIYIEGFDHTISGTVVSNIAGADGAGIIFYDGTTNTITSSCVIRYNRCNTNNSTYHGSGVCQYDGGDDFIQPGAIITNNYNGSTGTTEDNVYTYSGTIH